MKRLILFLILGVFILTIFITGCAGNIGENPSEKKKTAQEIEKDISEAKAFAAKCKKEISDMLNNAYSQKDYKEAARICDEAINKAFQCYSEEYKRFPLEVRSEINDYPSMGSWNDYNETDALVCYCEFTLADLDEKIHAEKDPLEKQKILSKRIEETLLCQNRWLSGLFDFERAPGVGSNDLDEATLLGNTCKDIIEVLKKKMRDENDPEKKSKLWAETNRIIFWCQGVWISGVLPPEMSPPIDGDYYGVRDFFIEDCLYRIKKARTEEERKNITEQCNSTLYIFFTPYEQIEKLKNPFTEMLKESEAKKAAFCGDGILNQPTEKCDPPNQQAQCYEGETCNNNCTCKPLIENDVCGDGILSPMELCDGDKFSQQCLDSHKPYKEMNPNLVLECYNNCKGCQSVPPNRE